MPFDEASFAGKSCNLDIFISFLTHNCVNPSDYLSHWQHYWIICRRLDLHFNWSQKDYNFVLHSLMRFLATFGLGIEWSDGSFIYVFDGHIYFNPKDIRGQDQEEYHLNLIYLKIKHELAGAYIAETCHKSICKKLSLCLTLQVSIGHLITYSLGYFKGWRFTSLVIATIIVIYCFLMLFLPETPYWLVEKEREEDAM